MAAIMESNNSSPYSVETIQANQDHRWAVLKCSCDPSDEKDALTNEIVYLVRKSFGEDKIIQTAEDLFVDELLEGTFNIEHLTNAIRLGLPNPEAEGRKPPQLTNYRSQTAEMIAKSALAQAFSFRYPVAPQEATTNPNQPILGFDGWGVAEEAQGETTLVLIQVKATDESKYPPGEATKLKSECIRIPFNPSPLSRALVAMSALLNNSENMELRKCLLKMLEGIGKQQLPKIYVAPVIVRGVTQSKIEDLSPIQNAADEFHPAIGRGASVSIGCELAGFGRHVMEHARRSA